MEKVRIAWLDVTKGILILFVLLSHSSAPNIYIRFFAPFFLTMFFFVSGYTFSVKDSFRTFIIGKIKRLFVPLISMGGIKLVLACILQGDSFPERVKGLLFQTSGKNDDLWFLGCMITATIMFYFVVRLAELWKEQRRIPVIVMLSAFLSLLGWCSILVLNAKWPWQLENALVMIFYMSMGYAYRRHESYVVNNIERKNLVVLGLGILYFIMFLTFDGSADIHKGIYTMPGAYIAMSFIAIPVLTSISKWISEFSGGVLQTLGRNTLFLYAFENYVILIFYKVCGYLKLKNPYILSLVCVLVTVAVLTPIAEVANKYVPWMVGGKKNEK